MSLFVLTVESISGSNVVGAYLSEKAIKLAASEYVEKQENVVFKKKLVKKDSEDVKKVLYVEDVKEGERRVCMNVVEFELPVASGKAKKVKDLNAPKKGMSAFMLFSNECRAKIKAENPTASFGEIGSKVGEAWKKLSDKEKEVYVSKAEKDKERYKQEMDAYTESKTEAQTDVVTETVALEETVTEKTVDTVVTEKPVKKVAKKK
jgi:hypothetical protein